MDRLSLMRPAPLPSQDEIVGLEVMTHAYRRDGVRFDEDDVVRLLIYRRALKWGLFTDELPRAA